MRSADRFSRPRAEHRWPGRRGCRPQAGRQGLHRGRPELPHRPGARLRRRRRGARADARAQGRGRGRDGGRDHRRAARPRELRRHPVGDLHRPGDRLGRQDRAAAEVRRRRLQGRALPVRLQRPRARPRRARGLRQDPRRREDRPHPRRALDRRPGERADCRGGRGDRVRRLVRGHRAHQPCAPVDVGSDARGGARRRQALAERLMQDVIALYEQSLARRGFVSDPSQWRAVERLQQLYEEWTAYKARRNTRLKRLLVRPALPKGVYLWGAVGRGKSFLMDSFYLCVPLVRKRRVHFHHFMREIHRELDALKGSEAELERIFSDLRDVEEEKHPLDVEGRSIAYRRRAGGLVWFDFAVLCGGPRSYADYVDLARRFHSVILSGVPKMSSRNADAARRFTWLVDVFYDERVKLIVSADARFAKGDAVLAVGYDLGVAHDGGYAEYARVPAEWLSKLPKGMSLWDAMAFGTAGFTAGIGIVRMEHNGLKPQSGPVIVDGATGGVGSIAIAALARLGYHVVALTGKESESDWLKKLGAKEVKLRSSIDFSKTRPLEKATWAGAVDNLGGEVLAWMASTMKVNGVIASIGLAASPSLNTTVLPFILRGVGLLGINSTDSPGPELRREVWRRLATDMRPPLLKEMCRTIPFSQLPAAFDDFIQGKVNRRIVVDLAE